MNRKLNVKEFDKKQKLVDFANEKGSRITIVSISSTQVTYDYKHFLWYYEE